MLLVNVLLGIAGFTLLSMGIWIIRSGRVPRWFANDDQPRRIGKYSICFAFFFLCQLAGYIGVELGLFDSIGRFVLVLAGFAAGVFALIRYRPRQIPRREAPKG
jgi:hypothetical protein